MREKIINPKIILFTFLLLIACHRSDPSKPLSPSSPSEVSGSVYELGTELTNQEGKVVRLDLYRGHPVIVGMFYSSCAYTCPLLFEALKRVEKGVDEKARENLRFLMISFDPEHDTPEVLLKKAQEHHVDLKRWSLLTASDEKIREIAAVLDVQYRKTPDGSYNHSSLMTLLDPDGTNIFQSDLEKSSIDEMISRIEKRKD